MNWFTELRKILCGQTLKEYIRACIVETLECEEIGTLDAWGFVGGTGELFNGCNVETVEPELDDDGEPTGRYAVTFTNPLPNPAYTVTFGNINNFATRDGRHTEVINGTQTVNGFEYYVATGDNGQAADILVAAQANFHVAGKRRVYICPEG